MSFALWKAWPLWKWLFWPDSQTLLIMQCHRLQLGIILLLLTTTCAIWTIGDFLELDLVREGILALVVVKQSCNKSKWNCQIVTKEELIPSSGSRDVWLYISTCVWEKGNHLEPYCACCKESLFHKQWGDAVLSQDGNSPWEHMHFLGLGALGFELWEASLLLSWKVRTQGGTVEPFSVWSEAAQLWVELSLAAYQ